MLTIKSNRRYRLCDGLSRRDFLHVGGLAMGGLTLPRLLQAEAQAGIRHSHKAVIMIYMAGAPPHQDMYDLKLDAPAEIRGECQPINTNVPGIQICESMPNIAKIMDKCVPLRSVYGSPRGLHDSYICYTARDQDKAPQGGWPSIGSIVSQLQGPTRVDVPPFVGLSPDVKHAPYGSPGLPGFLGVGHGAFRTSGPGSKNMVLKGVNVDRLRDRRQLLKRFDSFRRSVDTNRSYEGLDAITEQALGILTSSRLANALDLSKEDPKVLLRYGKGDSKNYYLPRAGDGAPRNPQHFLLARRLIEAGARVVTLNFGHWDFHCNNFYEVKNTHLPWFDRGLSALIEDLHERGMADDVSVVAWGEFGRTPRINKNAGRDHWPRVGGGLLAGGGLKTGQVIGATDRLGASIARRPVHFGEVHATLYHKMGINPNQATVPDLSGRPHYVVDRHQPMPELT